jgi:hypothetical protein
MPWRERYRAAMNCQIMHDSLDRRAGWTEEYFLLEAGSVAGYGSILVDGPKAGTRTVFEYYVFPEWRSGVFDLFNCLLAASRATAILAETNDVLMTAMLQVWGQNIRSEKIVFDDKLTTDLLLEGVTLRRPEAPRDEWMLEADGTAAAFGRVLFHYNRPCGDIYMRVWEPYRQRGLGSFLVRELKKACYERSSVPCARCNVSNVASRKTLEKAGFTSCAHILSGAL